MGYQTKGNFNYNLNIVYKFRSFKTFRPQDTKRDKYFEKIVQIYLSVKF